MNHLEEYQELLAIATRAALAAGVDIMKIYDDPSADFGIERKADNSPLTRADKAAHARIMTYLTPTDIPVLSEEGAHLPYDERRHWQRLWIVDPLDGTKEFIKRNGEFTVNIALVEDNTPVLGVIYVPVRKELYGTPFSNDDTSLAGEAVHGTEGGRWAWKAVLTEQQMQALLSSDNDAVIAQLAQISEAIPVQQEEGEEEARALRVVASRSHLSPETAAYINELRHEHPDLSLVSAGSSLKICLVAEGKAEIYPRHAPTMEWDTAAGHAIAVAAGCTFIDATTGQPLTYNKSDLHNPWFIVRRSSEALQ